MKLEIINPATQQETVKTYSVPDLSMFDFQEWQELNEVIINLNQLSNAIANLDSKDSETNEPISNSREVDFYLPDPIKNRAISQFTESRTGTAEPLDEIPNEGTDWDYMAVLKSSTILSVVVTEILQNHYPHSDYKVRISDG